MKLPDLFIQKITGAFGETGQAWLDILETRLETFLARWDLTFDSTVPNLSYNYVAKVTDSEGIPLILKLGVPNYDFQNEIRCLQAYAGQGCAKLIKSDIKHGAMLLERLDPGVMLSTLTDEEEVIKHFMHVWKAIRRPVPDGAIFPTILDWAQGLQRYKERHQSSEAPIPFETVNLAEALFQELTESSEGLQLLHGDLHHENILYSEQQGWMAIDPKGVVGDPYCDVVQFIVNQLEDKTNPKDLLKLRIDRLCEGLQLDRERLLKAAIAMGTLYACWGIEDNSDWVHTYQYVQWFQEFRIG